MYYSIDYYSYTIPTERPFDEGMFFTHEEDVKKAFLSSITALQSNPLLQDNWTHESASRFYQHRLRHDATGIALSYGKTNAHILVEFSGFTCNNLDAEGILDNVIQQTHSRCSRIDFAVDIECTTDPKEFIEQRGNKSFKSSGNKISPSGRTYYLGGRTSERMARVYRYNAPHPRSHLLRVEAEYKGDAAKAAAEHLCTSTLQQTCMDAHKPFSWEHPDWEEGGFSSHKIAYKAYNPQNASTVRWLYGDVITALRKAVKAELIDFDDWLKVYAGKPLEQPDNSPLS